MQIQFKGSHYELGEKVTTYASSKLENLKKYLGETYILAHAHVDLGKESGAHQSGEIWYADLNLDVDGRHFVARAKGGSVREAFDRAYSELAREVSHTKQKSQSLIKRGGAAVKAMLRGFGR